MLSPAKATQVVRDSGPAARLVGSSTLGHVRRRGSLLQSATTPLTELILWYGWHLWWHGLAYELVVALHQLSSLLLHLDALRELLQVRYLLFDGSSLGLRRRWLALCRQRVWHPRVGLAL